MSEDRITEKVYCYDHPSAYNNHDALAIAAMANRRNDDPMAMAAMMNQNQQWNNPFAYLIWMMFANRFMGDYGYGHGQNAQNVEMQNQLQAIRTQLQDNQNADCIKSAVTGVDANVRELAQTLNCDFNALKDCCCDVRAGISRFGDQIGYRAEQVIAAMERGNNGILQAVSNCCCETQKELIRMSGDIKLQNCQQTYELRNGQRDLGQAITQGFAASSYETQKQTCDIISAGDRNTQRILDTLNNHWKDEQAREIQDLKNENSNLKQTQYLARLIKGGDCGCGCGNGCGL